MSTRFYMTWSPAPFPPSFTTTCASGSLCSSPVGPLVGPQIYHEHSPLQATIHAIPIPSEDGALIHSGLLKCHFFCEASPKYLIHRVPLSLSVYYSFNSIHPHVALQDGRDSRVGMLGVWQMDKGRRAFQDGEGKNVMRKSERTQCPQNSESSWLKLCVRVRMKTVVWCHLTYRTYHTGFDPDKKNQ